MRVTAATLALVLARGANGGCPFANGGAQKDGVRQMFEHEDRLLTSSFNDGDSVPWDELKADIVNLFVSSDSQDFWPADFGHYGPFFVRLAWHCSGSYRTSDGRGGCDGARIRFTPELDWPDNGNLDKALQLLQPLKLKYGDALSWGDLIVLTGTTAIQSMGGPVLGFCAGRIDDADGYGSLTLGPSPEQEALAPCPVNGDCKFPLGQTTVGLIYVNPEGHLSDPVPEGSVPDIRDSFGRMGMNDDETVGLIGAHAFGKFHGACSLGNGLCGSGPLKGNGSNTYTSGFEGKWTETPTLWTNDYFANLLEYDWEKYVGPGGKFQWRPVLKPGAPGPAADIQMLTTDVALTRDPDYLQIVQEYAADLDAFDTTFKNAWYKLTSRDMGPVTRCIGPDVPPAQPFQDPLPPAPEQLADFGAARTAVASLLASDPAHAAAVSALAYNCASTFRATDYLGGCNGARIRFEPDKYWPANAGVDQVLQLLTPIKAQFDTANNGVLSWADLIVLAGTVANEVAGGLGTTFCGGRVDADHGSNDFLAPRTYYSSALIAARDNMQVMGLTPIEAVALSGRLRSPEQVALMGGPGSYSDGTALDNTYFSMLLNEMWEPVDGVATTALGQYYRAASQEAFVTTSDLALIWDPLFKPIVEAYATNREFFQEQFAAAWTKFMNADRFDGPRGNVCTL
ncbi:heme peroxidase [Tribonema minus]|uniref:Heme peroxidase n=1 Tax=Tribonema minus TaxID=303371 RepID=A0A836CGB9_9STRA|nr:heme peroxidase [Tribonema minus]